MAASNSTWYPTQYSFAGGEVSPRIGVRQDIAAYPQSVQVMHNMFPTLQGSTQRIPGFTFLSEISIGNEEDARIVGFRDAIGSPTLAILTGAKITIQAGFSADVVVAARQEGTVGALGITGTKQNIVNNFDFSLGGRYWNISYHRGIAVFGRPVGVFFAGAETRHYAEVIQIWSYAGFHDELLKESPTWFEQVVTVPVATDVSTLRYRGQYTAIPASDLYFTTYNPITQEIIDLTHPRIRYRITDESNGGALVLEQIDDIQPVQIGQIVTFNRAISFSLPGSTYTGDLKISAELYFTFDPPSPNQNAPFYGISAQWDEITIEADTEGLPATAELITPYFNDQLKALQYIQSPYPPYEVVFVHPEHPPFKLYWSVGGSAFVFEELIADPANYPAAWSVGNYPASCTAYQGRLILGGAGLSAHTIWGSESGVWDNFTIPATPTGKDPLEFTSTYRSAIMWMAGHKQLIVGTTELEYTVESASGILVSGDIDIRVNSSHGGINCQPAAYGDEVMFASERGSRIRAAARDFSRVGWTCKDMNLLAPHITAQGIVRIVRLRNPHPMLLCVLENGSIAVLHYDRDLEFHGWSTIHIQGNVIDITVMANSHGVDIPYAVIQRSIEGEFRLYVEGIPSFTEGASPVYMDSNVFQSNLTSSVVTGLDHLNGKRVQVVTEYGYMGDWVVLNGQIDLVDNNGAPLDFTQVSVGLSQPCSIATLPPVVSATSGGFLAKLRYNEVLVRVRDSTAPLIFVSKWENIVRPPDRSPGTAMDTVAVIPGVTDVKVVNLGWDDKQQVAFLENTPNRLEILAVSFKLSSKVI
jgi:hypothetical protein